MDENNVLAYCGVAHNLVLPLPPSLPPSLPSSGRLPLTSRSARGGGPGRDGLLGGQESAYHGGKGREGGRKGGKEGG